MNSARRDIAVLRAAVPTAQDDEEVVRSDLLPEHLQRHRASEVALSPNRSAGSSSFAGAGVHRVLGSLGGRRTACWNVSAVLGPP